MDRASALTAGFAPLGGVFLLAISSEKFRSAYQMGYPKRRPEKLFGLFCAGSDTRLLMLSIGLVVSDLTWDGSFLFWLLWVGKPLQRRGFGLGLGLCRLGRLRDVGVERLPTV